MAIKFQYNKTSLQHIDKQLKVRERALPTLKNKEAALRVEVKKAKTTAEEFEQRLNEKLENYRRAIELWGEFDNDLVSVEDVDLSVKKIAGVKTPVLEGVKFSVKEFSIFNRPGWYLDGISIVKELAQIAIEQEVFFQKMELLDHARRKTTQKVNLYEKVQIPGFQEAILKIKRYLEDEENLSKASQKIVKTRIQEMEASV
ncbi:MAG: V-type ATP synthase subunit D [Bacteroidales bacterium]|jgi:V/A-type H+-transporting ATPase subunit D|nr:V-type ATP synthase subunit D [Bacteroidales bacterium]NLM91424.1 V-type ATP synthase subunit D [Bacteroidales bacterium]